MNRQISPRYLTTVALGAACLLTAIVAGLPMLALLVSPLVALALVGPAMHRWPDLDVALG